MSWRIASRRYGVGTCPLSDTVTGLPRQSGICTAGTTGRPATVESLTRSAESLVSRANACSTRYRRRLTALAAAAMAMAGIASRTSDSAPTAGLPPLVDRAVRRLKQRAGAARAIPHRLHEERAGRAAGLGALDAAKLLERVWDRGTTAAAQSHISSAFAGAPGSGSVRLGIGPALPASASSSRVSSVASIRTTTRPGMTKAWSNHTV